MFKWFFSNLRTFGLAFSLAMIVWVSAVIADNPDETRAYPIPVTLEIIGQNPGLVITSELPRQVNLTLRAPQSVWKDLASLESPVRCILDLSNLDAGIHDVGVQVQIESRPVRIIQVSPEQVSLTLEKLETRTLPVEVDLQGNPALGYQAGSTHTDPGQVVISGPASDVLRVVRVKASIKVEGARVPIEQEASLQAVDSSGVPISSVTISPSRVQLSLPVSQQGGYRDIAVKVVVRGQVAGGYRLTNISVSPPALTVFSGDPNLVNGLPGYVETEPLNLNGANDTVETRLGLTLPAGVSVVGDQTVLVQVGVDAIQGSISLSNMKVEVVGLAAGMEAKIAPRTLDLILAGPLPLLDKLTPGDVQILVDLSDLPPGVHQVIPKVTIVVSDEIQVQSTNPVTVEVTILPMTTPTP